MISIPSHPKKLNAAYGRVLAILSVKLSLRALLVCARGGG